ncbi:MAG: TRAP transporter small permease [Rhodobacteraceae bacterium]|nr:TRAP transporter small permease [Paracoccaceae bacterium]
MSDQKAAEAVVDPRADKGAIAEAGLLGRAINAGGLVFAIGIVCAAAILINEVVLRYVFNAPTIWAHETTIFICGLAFIYGGLYCAARDQHIRVVLIYDYVPLKVRRALDIVISLANAAAAGMFAWAAWSMVQRAIFRPDGTIWIERSGSAWDPIFPGLLKIALFLIMILMCLQFLILAANYARGRK